MRGTAAAGAEGGPPGAGAEWGRPINGGPDGCGEAVSLGFGEAGLSQDVKKSSSSAAVLAGAEALEALTPSTDMPPGNLRGRVRSISRSQLRCVMRRNWAVSSLTRRASSSLYSSATRLVYFFFTSESFSNDVPPCRVKKSVAEALPPTFMVRSCESCQVSRFVDLGKKCS